MSILATVTNTKSYYLLLDVFSLFHRLFLNNTELKTLIGRPFNSVLFKKACERERIHLMSKRRLRKKL